MSWRSSLSTKPSRFWSIMLKASLNSWICDWSNMAKTLEVARWGRFLVVFDFVRLLDILASSISAPQIQERLIEKRHLLPIAKRSSPSPVRRVASRAASPAPPGGAINGSVGRLSRSLPSDGSKVNDVRTDALMRPRLQCGRTFSIPRRSRKNVEWAATGSVLTHVVHWLQYSALVQLKIISLGSNMTISISCLLRVKIMKTR